MGHLGRVAVAGRDEDLRETVLAAFAYLRRRLGLRPEPSEHVRARFAAQELPACGPVGEGTRQRVVDGLGLGAAELPPARRDVVPLARLGVDLQHAVLYQLGVRHLAADGVGDGDGLLVERLLLGREVGRVDPVDDLRGRLLGAGHLLGVAALVREDALGGGERTERPGRPDVIALAHPDERVAQGVRRRVAGSERGLRSLRAAGG